MCYQQGCQASCLFRHLDDNLSHVTACKHVVKCIFCLVKRKHAVHQWLEPNLSLCQMGIQGLEIELCAYGDAAVLMSAIKRSKAADLLSFVNKLTG